jgi:phosphoadenosine phosphosulfate reductase
VKSIQNGYVQIATSNNATPANVLFMKKLRKILRKSHYCVGCKVCEANCKFGNLHFDEHGIVSVSDECIKCGQCLDIDTGCFVYKSLWLSKGLGNMNKSKSLDCYAAHGPKMEWIQQFIKLGERFKSENTLGNNQVPNFYRFLRDAGVIEDERETLLAKMLKDNIDDEVVWALMLINLAYTPEVGWFVTHFGFNEFYPQTAMTNILGNTDGVSASAQKSIPAALKRFSLLPFQSVGFGITEKSSKVDGGSKFMRTPWKSVDQKVILYNLYKFAEACGDYKQFTLTRLMDSDVESDGITPTQIFGLDKETMTAVLNGLSANYPEFIHVSFTLDLDNITLSDDKTSKDVLDLFK